jgi:ferredoxin
MLSVRAKERLQAEPAQFIEEEIKAFASTSPLNRLLETDNQFMFDEPLVQFADGDDPIFTEYKTIIASTHFTAREALAETYNKSPQDMPARLAIISWILPITSITRESNRRQTRTPSRPWSYTKWHGEKKLNDGIREHMVELLTKMGYLAAAPLLQPYYRTFRNEKGAYSNWSERHIAYAAGLGTFSLSDGFITERGIAHRCGSVATDLELPISPRTATSPYSNCLFYIGVNCRACINRCPAGAITEKGHDKVKCGANIGSTRYLMEQYGVGEHGCGLCQTKVPCESKNPTKNLKKKTG